MLSIRFAVILAGLGIIRWVLTPADPSITAWFSHDSAYIAIVARNLLAGRGLINDSHWLLLDHFRSLPVPFHNANPLYPLVTAAVAGLTGLEVTQAGALLAILCWLAMGALVGRLVWWFSDSHRFALLAAGSVMMLPPCWDTSFHLLPDGLAFSLTLLCLVVLFTGDRAAVDRPEEIPAWRWSVAGLCFGLAWLTRSSVITMFAGFAIWLFPVLMSSRRLKLAKPLLQFIAVAAVTILPWLLYKAKVFGDPLFSDDSIALLQDYWSAKLGLTTEQYWRTEVRQAGLIEILRQSPLEFLRYMAHGFVAHARAMSRGLFAGSFLVVAVVGPALLFAVWRFARRWKGSHLLWASLAPAVATSLLLSIRGPSSETRYILWAWIWLAVALATAVDDIWSRADWQKPARTAAAVWLAATWIILLGQDVQIERLASRPNPALVEIQAHSLALASRLEPREPATHFVPYFYTYYTGRPSLSPLYASVERMTAFMRHFGSRYAVLPRHQETVFFSDPNPDPSRAFEDIALSPSVWAGRLKEPSAPLATPSSDSDIMKSATTPADER